MSILKKALNLLTGGNQVRPFEGLTERQLIELETEAGRTVFGPVPHGHRREFFCLDDHTWVWYEEWVDENKKKQSMTTRYEVHTNGILKAQNGVAYKFIEGEELQNLALATKLYYERVMRGVYVRDPATGKELTEAPATIE